LLATTFWASAANWISKALEAGVGDVLAL
jgi:hypothetical protein